MAVPSYPGTCTQRDGIVAGARGLSTRCFPPGSHSVLSLGPHPPCTSQAASKWTAEAQALGRPRSRSLLVRIRMAAGGPLSSRGGGGLLGPNRTCSPESRASQLLLTLLPGRDRAFLATETPSQQLPEARAVSPAPQ